MTPLHHFGEWLRVLLSQVPLGAARALFVLTMATLLVWVLTMPRSQTAPDKKEIRISENLKIWASVSLLIQLLIYLTL